MTFKLDKFMVSNKISKVLIFGLGINGGGLHSALFFLKNGYSVVITDLKDKERLNDTVDKLKKYEDKITYHLGFHDDKDFIEADLIIKNPAIKNDNKYLKTAIENNAIIVSDIELFLKFSPTEKICAVTGSKGKSTTVSCIYSILSEFSNNSYLGGNITVNPLSFIDELNSESLVILELSSWQLRDIADKGFHFKIALITNLMKDHLNYYKSMDEYLNDKLIISQNQFSDDYIIIPENDRYIKKEKLLGKAKVLFFNNKQSNIYYDENDDAIINFENKKTVLFNRKIISLPGEHISNNILLSAAFTYLIGVDSNSIVKGIENFKGAPFRLEKIAEINGVFFYNDTTATIPDAAVNALNSFDNDIIWIAGGNDKNLDFTVLKEIKKTPKKILFLTGNGTEKMLDYFTDTDYVISNDITQLFNEAIKSADKGDIVLLSPGCTSFGHFENEFHRGRVFNELVDSLIQKG